MRDTKKEHYIPRAAFLRRFSDTRFPDDHKNKLMAYAVNEDRCYDTNVYDSGFVNNLYEYEGFEKNALEKIFADLDSDLVAFFDELEAVCTNPENRDCLVLQNNDERSNIRFFMTWQAFRTEKRKALFRERAGGKEAGDIRFFTYLVGKNKNGEQVLTSLAHALDNHYCVFDWNQTTIPFVLPDDPVFVFHSDSDSEDVFNLRFPLTPWLQILAIDPESEDHEKVRAYRNRIQPITDILYVQEWNRKSIEEAYRTVYFTPGTGTIKYGIFFPTGPVEGT